jgi:hypothetical protein
MTPTPETSSSPQKGATQTWSSRFGSYFDREVAQRAAKSLTDGAEIEFRILEAGASKPVEIFAFTREAKKNRVLPSAARQAQVTFQMTPQAAEAILSDPSDEIGTIGVNILKMIVSSDPSRRVSIQLNAGFLTLFSKGYFGILTAGGAQVASFLASKGLSGLGAIKAALGKLRSQG